MDRVRGFIKNHPIILKFVKKCINIIRRIISKYGGMMIKTDCKMVMFDAFLGKSYACNPRAIYEEMLVQDKFKDWDFVWVIRNKKDIELNRCKVVKYGSFRYIYYLAKAKYWVFNSKMPSYIYKKKNQVYLQTWHGTPLKKLAKDIEIGDNATFYRSKVSKKEMVKSYEIDSNKYDYLISPNKYSTEKFISAFGVKQDIIIETGYPRNDILTNYTNDQVDKIKKDLGIDDKKKVILYAPTWRDNIYNINGYEFTPKVDFNKWKDKLGDEYVVIYKPHYLIVNNINNESLKDFIYYSKATDSINDLYIISDILITDYSSVFFDYGILKKPILFYMFDLKEYDNNLRGLYFDINQLPGPIIQDEDILIDNIKNIDIIRKEYQHRYIEFSKKMCYLEDGKATKRVIDKVFN